MEKLTPEPLQRVDDKGNRGLVQVRTNWNAEGGIGQLLRRRKITPLPAGVGVSSGKVGRHRIMNECADPGLLQVSLQFIA